MSRNGQLPEGWEICRLGDIGEVVGGGTPDSGNPAHWGGSIPWATPTDITNLRGKYINRTSQMITDEGLRCSSAKLHPAGTVLITSRASIGFAAINTIPMATNQGFQSVRCGDRLDNHFLYYVINQCQPELSKLASGSTFLEVSSSNMKCLDVLLPPLPEQRKIAEILGSVDENIEKTEALIAKLQDLKKATMQELLTKGIGHTKFKGSPIGKIPEEWDIKPLSSLASTILDGTHFTPTYVDSGIPFLRVTDIQSSNVDLSQVKRIPVEEHQTLIKRCKPERGDILCSKNGTIGIVKVVDWDWEFSIFVSLALIKPKNTTVSTQFLTRVLESPLILKQIRLRSKQGTVTNLHLEEIREFLIPIPPKDEQDKIVAALDAQDAYIAAKDACLTKLTNIKKALMQDLLTGKVRVKV